MTDRVIIDTCIWASVFAKAGSPHQQAVERLIDQDRAAPVDEPSRLMASISPCHVGLIDDLFQPSATI